MSLLKRSVTILQMKSKKAQQIEFDQKNVVKLYKRHKQWVTVSTPLLMLGVGTTFFGGHAVQAAENDTVKVNEQQAYSQAPQSELRVPTIEEAPSSAAPQSTATSGAQQIGRAHV